MNRPTTAKEALIAEVLGDMASLVNQIEKLEPLMNTSRKELVQVSNHLGHLARLAEPDQNRSLPWLTLGASFVTGTSLTWLVVVTIWVR